MGDERKKEDKPFCTLPTCISGSKVSFHCLDAPEIITIAQFMDEVCLALS